jgi:hypothetical protein
MNKKIYTKLFLQELGKSVSDNSISEHLPLWWQNTREKDNSGLRLTDQGFEVIQKIDLKVYDIPFPKDMSLTTQIIIFLDKFIDCPYYLTKSGILVTNEKKAVELALFSGDVRKYGLNKALTRSRTL